MRTFLVVLSAAVAAGLAVFFAFSTLGAIGVLGGNVVIGMDVFVAFVAVFAMAAAVLGLVYRRLLLRHPAGVLTKFE